MVLRIGGLLADWRVRLLARNSQIRSRCQSKYLDRSALRHSELKLEFWGDTAPAGGVQDATLAGLMFTFITPYCLDVPVAFASRAAATFVLRAKRSVTPPCRMELAAKTGRWHNKLKKLSFLATYRGYAARKLRTGFASKASPFC
jgi:hypothetical protein